MLFFKKSVSLWWQRIFVQGTNVYTLLQKSTLWKRQIMSQYYYENSFDLRLPKKGSGPLGESQSFLDYCMHIMFVDANLKYGFYKFLYLKSWKTLSQGCYSDHLFKKFWYSMPAQFWLLGINPWTKMDESICLHGAYIVSFDFHLCLGTWFLTGCVEYTLFLFFCLWLCVSISSPFYSLTWLW